MQYEKIILELMARIQTLEERMAEVTAELVHRYEDYQECAEGQEGHITRSLAREKAMEVIRSKFPDYIVDKASRQEGSGIKILKPDPDAKQAIIIIKFYHSKTYEHRTDGFEHAWHTVDLSEIIGSIYHYCLFSVVDKGGDWHFFIFEPDELGMYRDFNRSSRINDTLHLYFAIRDGKAREVRENSVDITDHLNNWDVLK